MGLERELSVAEHAVREAGVVVLSILNSGRLVVHIKNDGSPVTNADPESELTMIKILSKEFPDYGFVGEETGETRKSGHKRWVLDGVDGTSSLVNGEKTWAISLSLDDGGRTVLGAVYNPQTREFYSGAEGIETKLNGQVLPKRMPAMPEKMVVNYTVPASEERYLSIILELRRQGKIDKIVSPGGSIAYNLAQVAEGANSCYIYRGTFQPWDFKAGEYLIRSIGGQVFASEDNRLLVASKSPQFQEKIIGMLKERNFGGIQH